MGGLYNVMFGMNPLADAILTTLGLRREDCGRFRDCFITEGKIAVYTRNGGGNREGYMPDFSQHKNYLSDKDDDFDNTYATIYFSFPEEFAEQLKLIDTGAKFEPSKMWLDAIERLRRKA